MLIKLSDSLIENRQQENNFNLFLKNILIAYQEGKHLIFISPKNILELVNDESIKEDNRLILSDYQYEVYDYDMDNLVNKINNIVLVIPNNENEEIIESDNLKIRKLKIDEFLDSSNVQKTVFLGENDDDIEAYTLMAKLHMKNNDLYEGFKLQYENVLGGGSTAIKAFRRYYKNKEKFCLAILDKDKKSENYSIVNTTARNFEQKAKKLIKEHKNYKCDYLILDYLEIENYFPDGFYKNKNEKIYKEWLNLKTNYKDARKYFDFKNGLKRKLPEEDKPLKKEGIAYNNDWSKIIGKENFQINGFGEKILSNFIKLDHEEIFEMVENDKEIKEEWLTLGKTITSFLLGTSRKLI